MCYVNSCKANYRHSTVYTYNNNNNNNNNNLIRFFIIYVPSQQLYGQIHNSFIIYVPCQQL
jgi:hypothetical protein